MLVWHLAMSQLDEHITLPTEVPLYRAQLYYADVPRTVPGLHAWPLQGSRPEAAEYSASHGDSLAKSRFPLRPSVSFWAAPLTSIAFILKVL